MRNASSSQVSSFKAALLVYCCQISLSLVVVLWESSRLNFSVKGCQNYKLSTEMSIHPMTYITLNIKSINYLD